ncbi:hypothetical protein [Micromonospora sp. NPDC005806]|uniref:hypothetical protein n=1 Tax=Micromonospora sp. NPDC005806 TaxID=3364234 RepID=UPI003695AA13
MGVALRARWADRAARDRRTLGRTVEIGQRTIRRRIVSSWSTFGCAYIWNNTGDTAYLRNSAGTSIDTCSWGSSGSYTYC